MDGHLPRDIRHLIPAVGINSLIRSTRILLDTPEDKAILDRLENKVYLAFIFQYHEVGKSCSFYWESMFTPSISRRGC